MTFLHYSNKIKSCAKSREKKCEEIGRSSHRRNNLESFALTFMYTVLFYSSGVLSFTAFLILFVHLPVFVSPLESSGRVRSFDSCGFGSHTNQEKNYENSD